MASVDPLGRQSTLELRDIVRLVEDDLVRVEALFAERLPRLAEATGAEVALVPVTNEYFGDSVTVAGLLGGHEVLKALPRDMTHRDAVLLPGEALNADGLFIDDMSLDEFREKTAPATVTASRRIADSLEAL
ncbi:MAG: DUF512 domain-containing protein [Gemmatimonadetes bacterium]|nr:DUF512 domain-containing protein [Gemmatimonadota bacterium]